MSSSLYSDRMDLSNATSLELSFSYFPFSMEAGDRFHVEVDSGSGYQTYQTYVSGTDFTNQELTTANISIPSSLLSGNTSVRFRSQGDEIADYIILDDIVLEVCSSTFHSDEEIVIRSRVENGEVLIDKVESSIKLWPNPVSDYLNLNAGEAEIEFIEIMDVSGRKIMRQENGNDRINVSQLQSGLHFLVIKIEEKVIVKRFIKANY